MGNDWDPTFHPDLDRGDPLFQYSEDVPPFVLHMAKATAPQGGARLSLLRLIFGACQSSGEENPGLVALMAYSLPGRIDAIRRITKTALAGKDRDILKPFGYPSSNSFVRLLSKLRPDCCYPRYTRTCGPLGETPKRKGSCNTCRR